MDMDLVGWQFGILFILLTCFHGSTAPRSYDHGYHGRQDYPQGNNGYSPHNQGNNDYSQHNQDHMPTGLGWRGPELQSGGRYDNLHHNDPHDSSFTKKRTVRNGFSQIKHSLTTGVKQVFGAAETVIGGTFKGTTDIVRGTLRKFVPSSMKDNQQGYYSEHNHNGHTGQTQHFGNGGQMDRSELEMTDMRRREGRGTMTNGRVDNFDNQNHGSAYVHGRQDNRPYDGGHRRY